MATSTLKRVDLSVGGMSCASCVVAVERAIRGTDGVASAAVNLATERATVSSNPASAASTRSARRFVRRL